MFKVNNRNTRTGCEICSKLTIKIPEQRQWCRSGIFIVNFERTSHLVLVFLLLTFSRQMPAGYNLFFTEPFRSSKFVYSIENWEHIYIMRPKVSSNRFEISSSFQKMFRLHGDFTAATFQTIVRFYCTCAHAY